MSEKPNILILGATGKVGSQVVQQLVEAGDNNVIAATRSRDKKQNFNDNGIDSVILDLNDPQPLTSALKDVDRALLLTGYSVDMLRQSKRFLDAAKQTGVKHIVHLGTSGAPTNEVSHWDWHIFIEAYIEKLGFSYTHLRSECFMQIVLDWVKDGVIDNYFGDARVSWVDDRDLATVIAQTLLHPEKYNGRVIPLGYDAKTIDEIAQIASEVVGKPFKTKAHSPEEFLKEVIELEVNAIYKDAYVYSVYEQLQLNIADNIPQADATFDNFEAITGRKPNTWKDFILERKEEFTY